MAKLFDNLKNLLKKQEVVSENTPETALSIQATELEKDVKTFKEVLLRIKSGSNKLREEQQASELFDKYIKQVKPFESNSAETLSAAIKMVNVFKEIGFTGSDIYLGHAHEYPLDSLNQALGIGSVEDILSTRIEKMHDGEIRNYILYTAESMIDYKQVIQDYNNAQFINSDDPGVTQDEINRARDENKNCKTEEEKLKAFVSEAKSIIAYQKNAPQILLPMLQQIGVDINNLSITDMEKLLQGSKTTQLIPISVTIANAEIKTEARLSVKLNIEDSPMLCIHPVKANLTKELDKIFLGHMFTPEQKSQLLKNGNAGEPIQIEKSDGLKQIVLVSVDRLTKEIIAIPVEKIRIPSQFKGVELNNEQKNTLKDGKIIRLERIISKNGNEYSGNVQYNVDKQRLEIIREELNLTRIRGIKLADNEQQKLHRGKTILVPNMIDNKGQLYSAYVRLNLSEKTLKFYKENPNNALNNNQSVIPTSDHKIQVATNNNGQKTEANKHIQEYLKSGQKSPDKNGQTI